MRVKSIVDTRKLVKGQIYDAVGLINDPKNPPRSSWIAETIFISKGYNVERFNANHFVLESGAPIPKTNISLPDEYKALEFGDIKIGDILVYKSENLKSLIKGGKYIVEDKKKKGYSGSVKFKGVKRWLYFNSWKFRLASKSEIREDSLLQILEGKKSGVIEKEPDSRIDSTGDKKNKNLIEFLSKSIINSNRHGMDVIDWTIKKEAKNWKLKREDYDKIIDLPLREVLKMIDEYGG
jgi:hypothetical protein